MHLSTPLEDTDTKYTDVGSALRRHEAGRRTCLQITSLEMAESRGLVLHYGDTE